MARDAVRGPPARAVLDPGLVSTRTVRKKLITFLVPETIEHRIFDEVLALGANGCTACDARGRGAHGARPSTWAAGNLRIEVICDDAIVEKILAHIDSEYRGPNAVAAWVQDVDAWPADKFGG